VTTLALSTDFTIGLMQASDGNFYSTSGAANEGCSDNVNNQCSFIYKITPTGTTTTFHTFQEVPAGFVQGTIQGANADGLEPTSFLEGTDGPAGLSGRLRVQRRSQHSERHGHRNVGYFAAFPCHHSFDPLTSSRRVIPSPLAASSVSLCPI
jgi:hypothetical protein